MKRVISYLLLVLFVAFAFWRLYSPVHLWEAVRPLMDTVVTVKLCAKDSSTAQALFRDVFKEMARIDRMMDSYSSTSEVARIDSAAGRGWLPISPEMEQVLKKSQYISRLSDGAFDITIGPVEQLWGFNSAHPAVPPRKELASALALVDYHNLQLGTGKIRLLKPGMRLDLGGVAKGYAVDRAIELLQKRGVKSALVDAGGDICLLGKKPNGKPWRVAIRHPRNPKRLIRVKEISLPAVATSGDYERFFIKEGVRYHHILNPRTGWPAKKCVSVTVWAQKTMDADALATAVFVMGPEKGMRLVEQLKNVEALIFFKENSELKYRASSGVKGKFLGL